MALQHNPVRIDQVQGPFPDSNPASSALMLARFTFACGRPSGLVEASGSLRERASLPVGALAAADDD